MSISTSESLEIALAVGRDFGSVPGSISSVIRTLMHDHLKGAKTQHQSIIYHTSRVFRAPTISAAFYYAAQVFKPEAFEQIPVLDVESLVELFGPDEIAAVVAMVYITRKAKGLTKPDEWKYIAPTIQLQANIGGMVGLALPRIGFCSALLISALPCVALSAFQHKDEAGFKDYRRHLKAKNLVLDHAWERERWGCDSMEIAAKLAQTLGFGVATAEMFTHTLALLFEDSSDVVLDSLRLPVAYCWTSSLNCNGTAPDELDEERLGELWPTPEISKHLIERAEFAKGAAAYLNWLEKSKGDLSPELTPKLFAKRGLSTIASPAPSKATPTEDGLPPLLYTSLLPELREMISEEEFNSMSDVEKRQTIGDGSQH